MFKFLASLFAVAVLALAAPKAEACGPAGYGGGFSSGFAGVYSDPFAVGSTPFYTVNRFGPFVGFNAGYGNQFFVRRPFFVPGGASAFAAVGGRRAAFAVSGGGGAFFFRR